MTKNQALTALDRCDRCRGQAYVLILMPASGLDLLFCAHHWRQQKDVLEAQGAVVVVDETPALIDSETRHPETEDGGKSS